jgi:ribosomal protein S18 acetylase RimI-like enzyme
MDDAAVSIRLAGPADAEAIGALTREAYAKWVPVAGREPKPMTVDYDEAVKQHRFDLLFVAEELAALIETVLQGDELLIENVAVRPAFQKRGFGRQLLKLADDLAAAADLERTRLYTNKLFEENIRLYASLGYAIEREETLGDRTAVHMVKRLTSRPAAGGPFNRRGR